MSETVTYNEENKYIFIKSVGDVSVTEWENSLSLVQKIKESNGTNKVLVDVTEQIKTSGLKDVFEFAGTLPKDTYFALLVESPSHFPKTAEPTQRFLENRALIKGAKIRSFTDRDEAITWLADTRH